MKKTVGVRATDSTNYRRFMNDRNEALDVFRRKAQMRISDALRSALAQVYLSASRAIESVPRGYETTRVAQEVLRRLDLKIEHDLSPVVATATDAIQKMRRHSYFLSSAAAAEALARVTPTKIVADVPHQKLKQAILSDPNGDVAQKVRHALLKIKLDVLLACSKALVLSEKPQEARTRIKQAFPKLKRQKRTKSHLRALHEADIRALGHSVSTDLLDPREWDAALEEYKSEYVPEHRGSDVVFDVEGPPDYEGEWFGWEIERDINHEFVASVRSGEVDAAQANGVSDFVWISVLDNRTDECCEWRNGLTSEEIESKLDEHDDECDAIVPPAHANCRCSTSPLVEELKNAPPGVGDFEDWLR